MNTRMRGQICLHLSWTVVVATACCYAQVPTSNSSALPATQTDRTLPSNNNPAAAAFRSADESLTNAHVFTVEQMPLRRMANGGESRAIVHGRLATGETVNLHESTQPVGATPNPMHVIQHSEFILLREGHLEFQHELGGKIVSEKAGPGDVIYVARGTMHGVRNIGSVPAKYTVVAIGGDAK